MICLFRGWGKNDFEGHGFNQGELDEYEGR